MLRAGHPAEANAAAERAAALPVTAEVTYNLAAFHAVSGYRAGAIRLLRGSYEIGNPDPHCRHMMNDQDFITLHGDPEFEKIAAGVKERESK